MSELWKYFECQRCGKCCEEIGLPWDPERAQKIADFLNISLDELIERYYGKLSPDRKHWESEDHKRTPCPFLQSEGDKKRCIIYSVRPEGCRLYPIDTDFGTQEIDCPAAKVVYKELEESYKTEGDENMAFHRLTLLKFPFNKQYLVGPIAYIELGSHSIEKIDNQEHRCLSAECRTYRELEEQIRLLKKDLDQIAKQGKKFFHTEFERRRKWREKSAKN